MSLDSFLKAKSQFNSIEDFSEQTTAIPLEFLNQIKPADDLNVWAYCRFEEERLAVKLTKDSDFNNF
jgi:predicted nuclease of predicted toxin-antitoxin system